MVSRRGKLDADSSDDAEREVRRIYRKLKSVRCQISMKLKELKKEARETRHRAKRVELDTLEENVKEGAPDEDLTVEHEGPELGELGAVQSEVRTVLNHKTRLRKRFRRLQEELVKTSQS